MEAEDRSASDHVRRALAERPYTFDFFAGVRRLENLDRERPRVGHASAYADEAIHFAQEASLRFAPSSVRGFEPGDAEGKDRLVVSFAGLLGPNGPLPLHITEYAHDRQLNHHDPTLVRFLDVFNHRMLSLFYRAWASNQKAVSYERGPEADRVGWGVASACGLGMGSLRSRDRVPDEAKLSFAGHLAGHTRHAGGLRSILEDYFEMSCRVEEFVGRWIDLPPEAMCRLGASPESGALGVTTIVGERQWECQQSFRVVFGPMGLEDFERMLPGGASLGRLVDWIRLHGSYELRWDLQLILRREEVPPVQLGEGGRLGWTTWLASDPLDYDPDDLVIDPEALDRLGRFSDRTAAEANTRMHGTETPVPTGSSS